MLKPVYLSMAWQTMRKNYRIYLPFLLGSVVMVMMLYSFYSLEEISANSTYFGGQYMSSMLGFGYWIMLLFSLFYYFYLNGFLHKNRQQEYGLFSVLGLGKGHLIRILLYQTLMLAAVSLVFGVISGIVMTKLMFLLVSWMMQTEVPLGFRISPKGMLEVGLITLGEYGLTFLWSCWAIARRNPTEMMQNDTSGEQEPKARWIFAVIGLMCLGAGYYIALSVEDPLSAMVLFFVAVGLVMVGTYCLFMYGSITLLKMLEKNKSYYYKTNHFLNIGNMKYRMKQNAVSLANICILSTMILVAVSTTVSLYLGIDGTVALMYPRENFLQIQVPNAQYVEALKQLDQLTADLQGSDPDGYAGRELALMTDWQEILPADANGTPFYSNVVLPSYPGQYTTEPLGDHEVAIYEDSDWFTQGQTLRIGDQTFTVKEVLPKSEEDEILRSESVHISTMPTADIIVPNMEAFSLISPEINIYSGFNGSTYTSGQLLDRLSELPILAGFQNEDGRAFSYYYEATVRSEERDYIVALYSSFLFLGIFISLLLLTIIILIMYYKQISEGYQDKKRYQILQNVGLEKRDIKKIINQQALWMFFLPLIFALIHIMFAYPMIAQMLDMLVYGQGRIFMICTITCVVLFALIYLLIYKLTARIYYSIVTQRS